MAFSAAQVFYIDPSLVASSPTVDLDRIDLYFKSKPQATNNKSGINNPGVNIYIVPTSNTIPQLPALALNAVRSARQDYNSVVVSNDASLVTTFRFDPPVLCSTGQNYAFILAYDGDEDFQPWLDTAGEVLIGTQTISTGAPSTTGVGPYFSFISAPPVSGGNNTSNSTMVSVGTPATTPVNANGVYTSAAWSPKIGTSMKFNVFCARYTVQGNANLTSFVDPLTIANAQIFSTVGTSKTANGEFQFQIPQDRFEYLAYDRINSTITNIAVGERVFPILPQYPPGQAAKVTLNCVAGNTTIVASGNVNFNNFITITPVQPEYIIIFSNNHFGNGASAYQVRQVTGVLSNTSIIVDTPLTISNATATFWRAPIAVVDQFKTAKFFGNTQDVVIAKSSTANSTIRFTSYSVNSVSVAAGGTGYNNTDILTITGHVFLANKILAAYNANATISTNSSGGITALYLANVGANFANIANVSYSIANSIGGSSAGSGANLTISIGTNLQTEFAGFNGFGGNFANAHPIHIDIGQVMPAVLVSNPAGTFYQATLRFPYYEVNDNTTPTGTMVYCDPDGGWDTLNIINGSTHYPYEFGKVRVLPSWSGELFIPYANGSPSGGLGGTTNNLVLGLTSNASVITITSASNNDFTAATMVPTGSKITFSRYIINNDYTAENTNYGNAWAKGIEAKFNLAANVLSEDLRVYATCYQPANTQVLCFAKIYNTNDNDAFDTKDWTMMQLVSGQNVVSSSTKLGDVYELQWGFQQYPNVAFQITGSVITTNGSTTISGANTNFSNLVSGDVVVIQNNLFPNSYMVSVVNTVTNSTSLTITKPVANLNLVGSGFIMSKVAYPFQAFNNYLNDNVVRYYSSTKTENDGFNACAIKLVMLAANGLSVPLINDLRAIAVSA